MTKRNYIGLATTWHDSALAIVNSRGEIVFAEATERYLQNKRALQMRPDVYRRCSEVVAQYGEPGAEIVIASSWSDQLAPRLTEGLARDRQAMDKLSTMRGELSAAKRADSSFAIYNKESQIMQLVDTGHQLMHELRRAAGENPLDVVRKTYDHHLTHAATGCYTSPFSDAVCLIVDGEGEYGAHSCFTYANGKLTPAPSTASSGDGGSLGMFYSKVCELCGFDAMAGEEWKVMGLAPYGRLDEEIYGVLKDVMQVQGLDLVAASESRRLAIWSKMKKWARKPGEPALSVADLAFTGQAIFSELLFQLIDNAHALSASDNLVLGGGCALNSSANGRVLQKTKFNALHVYSAPADDGNAVGAALLAYHEDNPEAFRSPRLQSPYLGSRMSQEAIENVRKFSAIPKMTVCNRDAPKRAAQLLAQNKIIGWIQGAAEFGPRALGNRSILADPRSASVKAIINERVKFREEFRPFAPSILAEYGRDYFEAYTDTPYMEKTLSFRDSVKHMVPGVVHDDGTGRLQTVRRDWNPRYHELITHFNELTGIPLVLNTSFNVMGKPIAHSVEDAIAVFYTSGLDALFIEDLLIEK